MKSSEIRQTVSASSGANYRFSHEAGPASLPAGDIKYRISVKQNHQESPGTTNQDIDMVHCVHSARSPIGLFPAPFQPGAALSMDSAKLQVKQPSASFHTDSHIHSRISVFKLPG
jgi:hypothetical protein